MTGNGLEIERKYRLAVAPGRDVIVAHGGRAIAIEQVYLTEPPSGRRLRRTRQADGTVERTLTRKRHLRGLVREEIEHEIGEDEYETLLEQADPIRRPIRKTRYVVPHGDQLLEIDVFDQPPGLVLAEVELRSEDEAVSLPEWLGDHRDVSEDPRYANVNLARIDAETPPW